MQRPIKVTIQTLPESDADRCYSELNIEPPHGWAVQKVETHARARGGLYLVTILVPDESAELGCDQ